MAVLDASWPWKTIDFSVLERHSTFPLEELNKFIIFLLGLIHALLQPKGSKRNHHVMLWFAALLGGIGSDMIFTYLPLVDNFFHAQATFMVYPRLPAYIVFFYIGWYYIPMAICWQLNLSPLTESIVSSFLSLVYYAPWDIVGIKHLWWTWHDSDSPLTNRYLLVPIASTMFVLVQSFVWARLVRLGIGVSASEQYNHEMTFTKALKVCTLVILCTVPGLFTLMGILQSTFTASVVPPPTELRTLILTMLLFIFVASVRYKRGLVQKCRQGWILYCCVALHLGWMLACTLFSRSEMQTSTGVHQKYGDCFAEDKDLTGTRHTYVCEEKYKQDFRFRCEINNFEIPRENSSWYSICGTEKSEEWIQGSTRIICFCALVFVYSLFLLNSSTKSKQS